MPDTQSVLSAQDLGTDGRSLFGQPIVRLKYRALEYAEYVTGAGLEIVLSWGWLATHYDVDMPPDLTATGRHRMDSLFVDSDDARCIVRSRRLPGHVVSHPTAGHESRSAFLAFSETWPLQ